MRVVQVVQHLRPGGLEVTALNLLEHSDADTHIVSLDGEFDLALHDWPRLQEHADRLHFLNKPAGLNLQTVFRLRKLLRKLKPDAVHTHHIGPLIYGGLAARLAGVKTVLHTEHDAWHLRSLNERRLQGFVMRLVRPIVAGVGSEVTAAIAQYFPWTRPIVVHNGVDTDRFMPIEGKLAQANLGLPAEGKWIGCAARLETVKGVDILLQAFAIIARDQGGVCLMLAGQGTQRDALQAQAEKLEIDRRVFFLGHVENMSVFYNACDVYCQPSRSEGLPLAPLEALSCGRPSVITDVGSCSDLENISGVHLVDSENPDALAMAINSSLEDSSPLSRPDVEKAYSVKVMANRYLDLMTGAQA